MILYLELLALLGVGSLLKEFLTPTDIKLKADIRTHLKEFIREKHLINSSNEKILIDGLELNKGGFTAVLDLSGVTDFSTLEKYSDYLKQLFRASSITLKNTDGKAVLDVITQAVTQQDFKQVDMTPTQLLLGFDNKGRNIIIDMLKTPHALISGLSGQGKTGMLKVIIKNLKGADIVLCNAFSDDFKSFNLRKIYGEKDILAFLENLLEHKEKRKKPLYIIMEELGTIKDKALINTIKEFLCIARHFNIYVIGVIQIATKEELKFKSYFNSRISFKQQDLSSYSVALGCSVEKDLSIQEFYLMSEGLKRGYTFTIN